MNQPPYYFQRAFVLPLPGRDEVCRVGTLEYTEQEVEVLRSWKKLGANVYFDKYLERAQEIEAFLQQCLQETEGSRLRDAYEERERLAPHIPSGDPRFYTHCQVCHEPIAGRKAAWHAGQYHEGACYETLFKQCYGCGEKRMDVLTNARNWKRPDSLCDDCYHLKYGIGYSMQTWLKIKKMRPNRDSDADQGAEDAKAILVYRFGQGDVATSPCPVL